MKIRQIERDLLIFFPIVEIIIALSISWDYYIHGTTYTIMNYGHTIFSPITWTMILLIGGLCGLAYHDEFYWYYGWVSLPLQLFAIETYHLSMLVHNDTPLVVIIMVLSLASSVFIGKILPRKKIWIF